jgi:hypothetical protein
MIEATGPVYPPGDTFGHEAGIEQVSDPAALINYVDDAHASKLSGVERLTTRGWIERGAIEVNTP